MASDVRVAAARLAARRGRQQRTATRVTTLAHGATYVLASLAALVLLLGKAAVPAQAFSAARLGALSRGRAARRATVVMSAAAPKSKPRVVVAGGGFGGLYSALRLAELAGPGNLEVTLVDRRDRFLFLPLLYELAVGDAQKEEVAPSFRTLLADTGVKFLQGEVTAVDADGKAVAVTALGAEVEADPAKPRDRVLPYDRLVLALGSEPAVPAGMGGMAFYTLEDADSLAGKLREVDALTRGGARALFRVVVVGGGYSGVELAANLAARLGRDSGSVTLVDRGFSILHNSPDHVRAAANKRLVEEGVEVLLGMDVAEATDKRVVLRDRAQVPPKAVVAAAAAAAAGDGEEAAATVAAAAKEDVILPADLVIWTAGASVNPLVRGLAGFDKDERGKLRTDAGLRAKGPAAGGAVYVVGDDAAVQGYEGALPATAQVAFQESEVAAWNVWSGLTPSAPGPLRFQYTPLGEMLTLGPMDAAISGLKGLFQLEGPPASLARRLVYVMRQPTNGQRLRAAKSWIQSRRERLQEQLRDAFSPAAGAGGGGQQR